MEKLFELLSAIELFLRVFDALMGIAITFWCFDELLHFSPSKLARVKLES